jgi:UV DNA damage endonuclease
MNEEAVAQQALATWDREPLFHISSPLKGWDEPQPNRHHDYIDIRDFPMFWRALDVTVEVEAKAKELAVKRLAKALAHRGIRTKGLHIIKPNSKKHLSQADLC